MPIVMSSARAISTARTSRTATKARRSLPGVMNTSSRAPRNAPTTEPRATGPAISGAIAPRTKYAPALAAAVTPIMKFDVADETLIGSRSAVSIAGIFKTPLPMPRSAESRPAPYIRPSPSTADPLGMPHRRRGCGLDRQRQASAPNRSPTRCQQGSRRPAGASASAKRR